MAGNAAPKLVVASDAVGQTTLLTAQGLLDATTYLSLRDSIIKAALDAPRGVLVDMSELFVPRESALAVFTSARWHVQRWPEVPILVICDHPAGRDALMRNGVTRFVPVYPALESASEALSSGGSRPGRIRAHLDLPAHVTSLRRSRRFVSDSLSTWSMPEWIPVTKIVVTTLVENVLAHTDSQVGIRLETDGATVTVAVEDSSHSQANIREPTEVTNAPTGLSILDALCRMWGNSPMPSGKTVWAVIGPEHRL